MKARVLTTLCLTVFGLAALAGEATAAWDEPRSPFDYLANLSTNGSITERLFQGQRITASGCYYQLGMDHDGEMKIWAGASGSVVWSTHTGGAGAFAVMHHTGELVVRDWTGDALWRSGTTEWPGAHTRILEDGRAAVVGVLNFPPDHELFGEELIFYSTNPPDEDPIGSTVCPRSEKTEVHWNADIPGGDYAAHWLSYAHMSSCGDRCAADPQCEAFTYVPPGVQGAQARCWLKSSVSSPTASTGMVSGRIFRHDPANDW
ncbi:PAN domain-containing protein [Sorangium sp. So ce145]|uniref:PAN domain-containing protein n=1 Tax=Sorangium sp. So ce145 TaxID=3133285 RepID=UPI003F63BB34